MQKPILLCLHGWGGSKESFTELRAALAGADVDIRTPDLPGFGAEPEPDRAWTNDDYADWVVAWAKKQGIAETPLLLLGHSHGGRIAIILASRLADPHNANPTLQIKHLYLCAAAGIKHPRHLKRIVGLTLSKSGKFFLSIPLLRSLQPLGKKFLYKLVRVHDYEKASPRMRDTMINVAAQDLRPILPRLATVTDIFWGQDDRMTPVSDAHVLHERIAGSNLVVFPETRHNVHRVRAKEIAEVVRREL
jgi:pimeloyl-ACP methyl ester carboxylesterase